MATPCSGSGQCSRPTPYCDTAAMSCVQCLGDPNCAGTNRPHCTTDTHQCVQCTSDGQCGNGQPYCTPQHACVECLTAGNCGMNETCDPTRHTCVPSCKTDGDCSGANGRPYCDTKLAVCVQCLGNNNCSNPDRPTCVDGVCAECTSDADCGAGNPYCQTMRHRCVECVVDANCQPGETCDPRDFTCQG
jgi:Cys-rich repeat protein